MKFAVGYQMMDGEDVSFPELVNRYRESIEEVYFPWMDMASGRSPLTSRRGYVDWYGQRKLEEDIIRLKDMGLKLDLLFNASCYGRYAVSQYLANQVCSILEHLGDIAGGVDIVTTTSPAVAYVVKRSFPEAEVRASVNMRIGTVKGMQYVSHLFDSFYLQREYNRDFERIRELKSWADANGKKLLMLANSGCMSYCSGQAFHDNMVSHEREIAEIEKIPDFLPHVCWNYYKNKENRVSFLQSTWVRPEDIDNYEPYFKVVKLATRMHSLPGMVINAYVRRKYSGNLLDLFEPGFGPAFAPYIIDNSKFPENWFENTVRCSKKCHECGYCKSVFAQVAVNTEGMV